jgi:hypothetical protein
MGCCDSKPEPPPDIQMDFKPPKVMAEVEEVEEEEPYVPVKIEGDENKVIDFDFISISTGKLELTTYPKGDSDLKKTKTVLYTGEHELGNGLYLVEIYSNEKDEIFIDATHKERPEERFIIENDKAKSKAIQDEFNNDFYDMAEHLRVMNKRMILMMHPSGEDKDQAGK